MPIVQRFGRFDGSTIELALTTPADGDLHIDTDHAVLTERRARIMDGEWAVIRQVHGTTIVDAVSGGRVLEADGIVTGESGRPIAVHGADCAPVAFITNSGPFGLAHVGWRGLQAGIVEAMVDRLGGEGASVERVVIGSTIGPECYEFGEADLDAVATKYGDEVRAVTADGQPALDLRAGITRAAALAEIDDVRHIGGCTACERAGFSHRARNDVGRHALVARIVATEEPTS